MLVRVFKRLRQKTPGFAWGVSLALLIHAPFLFLFREYLQYQQNFPGKSKKATIPIQILFSEKTTTWNTDVLMKREDLWCAESEICFPPLIKLPISIKKDNLGEYPSTINIKENLPSQQQIVLEKNEIFLEKSYYPIEISSFDLPANRILTLPSHNILKLQAPNFPVEVETHTFDALFDNYSGKILDFHHRSGSSNEVNLEIYSIVSSISINPLQESSTLQCTVQIIYRSEKSSD